MTAKELLALMDEGKVNEAKSKIKGAKDLINGVDPQEPANTPQGLLERITSTKADSDAERSELHVRLNTMMKQEDVSAQANEVQKQAAVREFIKSLITDE